MSASRKTGTHVTFRVEPALRRRLDALIPYFSSPWYRATRSDVVRALILAALRVIEEAVKAPKKGAPR